jgi:two-component SAPR family response regulator
MAEALTGLRVLIVEDEAVIAIDLANTLREFGCVVLPLALSVAKALEVLRTQRPDVALLDVNLCDGRVTPVAEALTAMGVSFVVVTGYVDVVFDEPVLRDAAKVSKPYSTDEIERTILRLLGLGQV